MTTIAPPPNNARQNSRFWNDWFTRLRDILNATDVFISDILSRYSIKVTAGGAIAGIGLIATDNDSGNATSAVIIQADKFAIVDSSYAGGPDNTPDASSIMFAVDGDGTYLAGNLKVNGKAIINGNTTVTVGGSPYTAALQVNPTGASDVGFTAHTDTVDAGVGALGVAINGGYGIQGVAIKNGGTAGAGVGGVASGTGLAGVRAEGQTGAAALEVIGTMSIDNATLVTNLNADKLDGLDAGNANGNVPISNGTVCTNLNAAKLAGYSAGTGTGNIPVSSGTVCTNLNADMLDGLHAASFASSTHNHDGAYATLFHDHAGVYLPVADTAANSTLWNGLAVQAVASGSAIPTLALNKPGSNSSCFWLQLTAGGSTYYFPVWT